MTLRLLVARASLIAMVALYFSMTVVGAGVWGDRLGPIGVVLYVAVIAVAYGFRLAGRDSIALGFLGVSMGFALLFMVGETLRAAQFDPTSSEARVLLRGRMDLLTSLTPLAAIGLTQLVVPIWQGRDPRATADARSESRPDPSGDGERGA